MIGKINFTTPLRFMSSNKNYSDLPTRTLKCDEFVRSQEPCDKKMQAYTYAKNRIIKELLDTGYEYQVVISPDGDILDEGVGDDNFCSVNVNKIVPNSELFHGHPKSWPLSVEDVAMLLYTDAISEKVLSVDGRYSKMIKKTPFKLSLQQAAKELSEYKKQMGLAALDKLGISYEITMDDVLEMARQYFDYTMCAKCSYSDEDLLCQLKQMGIDVSQTPESIAQEFADIMPFDARARFDISGKADKLLDEKSNDIKAFLETPEGVKVRHNIDREIAKVHDLIYETNME